jgi:RecA-family ATPase
VQNLDQLYPVKEFKEEVTVTQVPWMIRDLWQLGKINVMFGAEKAGKSRLLNWLLVNLFTSESVLNLPIESRPKRVLYLAGEEITDEINARMLRYAAFATEGEQMKLPIDFISASGMRLEWPQYRQWLENKLLEGGYDMLVADPLRRIHGADENDNSVMANIFNDFSRWRNNFGITMVLLHHTGKLSEDADISRIATWGRGATDLAAILDTAQFVQRLTPSKVRVMRAGRFPPMDALSLADGFDDRYVFKRESK